jgi:CDP-diacylglycerol--glycerol-3-phosphate 3-phosphatidyltransferase
MKKFSYYIVNGITLYRIVTAPLLLALIIFDKPDLFKWLLACSFFTDAIDGFLARRYKVTSKAGAKLDSIGDDLTVLIGLIGIIVFKPEFIRREMVLIICLLALFLVQVAFALVKYRKITTFHTYAAKLAAILQGSFLILLFFLPEPVYMLFYFAAVVTFYDLIEEIILVHLLPKPETNVKGLYWFMAKNRTISTGK